MASSQRTNSPSRQIHSVSVSFAMSFLVERSNSLERPSRCKDRQVRRQAEIWARAALNPVAPRRGLESARRRSREGARFARWKALASLAGSPTLQGGDCGCAGDERQHNAFDEHQRREPHTRDSKRKPNRDLAPAAKRAREQQIRDVRAGDQQHDRRNARETRRDQDFFRRLQRTARCEDRPDDDRTSRLAARRRHERAPERGRRDCFEPLIAESSVVAAARRDASRVRPSRTTLSRFPYRASDACCNEP